MDTPLADAPETVLRLADLANRKNTPFLFTPTAAARAALAQQLGIVAIKKLRFEGKIGPLGAKDWELSGKLGATIVQECVVTLVPVTTRIDEDVLRRYLANFEDIEEVEAEMPEDDSTESLPEEVDLMAVMVEQLSLALPTYPRAPDASLGEAVFSQTGITPLKDEDTRPFAGLSDLRDALKNKDDNQQ